MAARGSTTERGYGIEHQRVRELWKPEVETGTVACWRCSRLIGADERWHLGHDDMDRTVYRGPEHVRCNVATMTRGRATAMRRTRDAKNRKRFIKPISASNARMSKSCDARDNGNNALPRAWIRDDQP